MVNNNRRALSHASFNLLSNIVLFQPSLAPHATIRNRPYDIPIEREFFPLHDGTTRSEIEPRFRAEIAGEAQPLSVLRAVQRRYRLTLNAIIKTSLLYSQTKREGRRHAGREGHINEHAPWSSRETERITYTSADRRNTEIVQDDD